MQEKISSYDVLEEIGTGGMGVVHKARHAVFTDRIVAIKTLYPQFAKDPNFRTRFLNEAKTMNDLKHPNVVSVIDFVDGADGLHMIMEFVPGKTLHDILHELGPMPYQKALPIFFQVLDAIAAAHEKEIVHRDIKPANILITPENVAKVTDFGIARISGLGNMTRTGAKMGTIYYMSPEQIQGERVDSQTDVYALGMTLYEMLSGRLPFEITPNTTEFQIMQQIVQTDFTDPRSFNPAIPDWLVSLLLRSIAKKKEDRIVSVVAFKRLIESALQAIEKGQPIPFEVIVPAAKPAAPVFPPISIPDNTGTVADSGSPPISIPPDMRTVVDTGIQPPITAPLDSTVVDTGIQPPITAPPITVPPITVPPITTPPDMRTVVDTGIQPPITVPPITVPPITTPPDMRTVVDTGIQPPITAPPITTPPDMRTVVDTGIQPPITTPPITTPPDMRTVVDIGSGMPPITPPVGSGPIPFSVPKANIEKSNSPVIFILIIAVIILGVGGYFGYQYFFSKSDEYVKLDEKVNKAEEVVGSMESITKSGSSLTPEQKKTLRMQKLEFESLQLAFDTLSTSYNKVVDKEDRDQFSDKFSEMSKRVEKLKPFMGSPQYLVLLDELGGYEKRIQDLRDQFVDEASTLAERRELLRDNGGLELWQDIQAFESEVAAAAGQLEAGEEEDILKVHESVLEKHRTLGSYDKTENKEKSDQINKDNQDNKSGSLKSS